MFHNDAQVFGQIYNLIFKCINKWNSNMEGLKYTYFLMSVYLELTL